MTVKVELDARKLRAANKTLVRLQKQVSDLRIPHKKISIYLDRWVQLNFKGEGKPIGGWVPFKSGGRNGDTSAKLLQDTGRLRASFLPFSSKKTAGVGSDLDYSKAHEEGSGHVPQRRILPERAEVLKDVITIYENHIARSIDKS